MPKLKGQQNLPNEATPPAIQPNFWSGSWGKINPLPQSAQTLRLCKRTSSSSEESFSYPYRNLSSWQWRRALQEEELKIEAGADAITLRGKGLGRLLDALDAGALEVVRENSFGAASSLENCIVVQLLMIEKTKYPYSLTGAELEACRVKAE